MKQKQYIETTRLILRDWKEEGIAHLARMDSDDRVMEYFLKTLSYEETVAMYNQIQYPNHPLYRHMLYKIDWQC